MVIEDGSIAGLHHRIVDENGPGAILEWPMKAYRVRPGYDRFTVERHCTMNKQWQCFRLTLKKMPTHKKLEALIKWWEESPDKVAAEVQVGNYLGALRRGGQLDMKNVVRKYK